MKQFTLFIGSILMVALYSTGQVNMAKNRSKEIDTDQSTLAAGDVAALNLTSAEEDQLVTDPSFIAPEPTENEKVTQPGILFFKNSDGTIGLTLDWTTDQHARSLLESLRLSIYRYQAGKPNPGGVIGVQQAAELWPKLQRIYCRENPGGRYIDLQGQVLFCEGKHVDVNVR